MGIALRPIRREATEVLDALRLRDEAKRREILNKPGCSPCDPPPVDPTYFQTFELYEARKKAIPDPTTLILVDEADRLQMNSLEQMRSIFDEGHTGMVLIGMPGIEKRIARFPQLYSRIGFVREFRPLDATEMRTVRTTLDARWSHAARRAVHAGGHGPIDPYDRRQFPAADPAPHANRTRSRCERSSDRFSRGPRSIARQLGYRAKLGFSFTVTPKSWQIFTPHSALTYTLASKWISTQLNFQKVQKCESVDWPPSRGNLQLNPYNLLIYKNFLV
jgi:hypothetical protein